MEPETNADARERLSEKDDLDETRIRIGPVGEFIRIETKPKDDGEKI